MIKLSKLSQALVHAFGTAALVAGPSAMAQQSSVPDQAQKLERVEITGSSIKRVAAETALPVTVIKVEELARQGVTTAEQALSRITANQSNIGASSSVGGITGGKAEADIRGLSGPLATQSNKTLVLLNGRRLAPHSFDAAAVDLNAIPLAAIDRIEVLRDGASAIYGTDAIGGVVNFIVRRDYTGLEISAQTQQPQKSASGATDRLSLTGGYGSLTDNGFNILGAIDYRKQKALLVTQRSFSKTGILHGQVSDGTSGSSFPGDLNGFEPSLPGCAAPNSVPNETGTSCRYDFSSAVDAIPKNEQLTGLLRGTTALGPSQTASLEYSRSRNKTISAVAAAPVSHLMRATSPYFPAGAPVTQVSDLDSSDPDATVAGGIVNWREVPGGRRTSANTTTTDRFVVELQGSSEGWDYRTGLGRSTNKSTDSVLRGYLDDELVQQGVWDGIVNPFGAQTAAGASLIERAQVKSPTQIGKATIDFIDARVSRDLVELPAGPLTVAFGVEFRKEHSAYVATDITGSLPSLGLDPDSDTSGGRKVGAFFTEFNMPITKAVEVTAALRYDKYNDFGDTLNPKLGIRFQPTKGFLIRGSYNTGFRAPTLYEIYRPEQLTITTDSYDDPLLCPGGKAVPGASEGVVCAQQVDQRLVGPVGNGGKRNTLRPETSRMTTFGFVFEPASSVTVGVDFWQLTVDNLIGPLPEQEVFAGATKYASRFVRCSQLPTGSGPGIRRGDVDACLNYPNFDPIAYIDTPDENLGRLKTRGIDLDVSWRSPSTEMGRFGVSLDGTYVTKYKYQRERGGAFINAVGRYSDNAPVFRWQHSLTLSWNRGPWALAVAQRFKTGYTDQDPAYHVASYTLHDVALTWTGVKNLTVTAAVNNLFDRDPPQTVQNTNFQRGYDPRFTDPIGRSFMLRMGYKFL